MSTAKFENWVNPDGTTNYKCRAWVNFNGTGTVAIRAAGNVTSITDGGTGTYTVNFTTAMPDADYSMVTGPSSPGDTGMLMKITAQAVGSFSLFTYTGSNVAVDNSRVLCAIFR